VPLTASLEAAIEAIKHLKGPHVFCNPDGRPLSLWQPHEVLWGHAVGRVYVTFGGTTAASF
jgi:hypothetical protein